MSPTKRKPLPGSANLTFWTLVAAIAARDGWKPKKKKSRAKAKP